MSDIYMTDSDSCQETLGKWNISPQHFPVYIVEPPRWSEGFIITQEERAVGGYRLVPIPRVVISDEMHNELLTESIEEHEAIWRSLAQK